MPEIEDSKLLTNNRRAHVAVCVCTYQRPEGLEKLLNGLCEQTFEDVATPMINIIVTDNECSDINRAICDRIAHSCHHSLLYVQEYRRGVSYARNTCLDNLPTDCDFVAMIDDDEIPEPSWLNHLLYAQQKTSADIVTGPTLPIFEDGTPDWIVKTGYFVTPREPDCYKDLEPFPPAATGNVLTRADIFTLKKMRFDPVLALSGSEDKLLFQDLRQRGLSFVWASKAIAYQTIPSNRAHIRYMISEALRRGSTKFYVKSKLKASTRSKHCKLAIRSVGRSLFGIIAQSCNAWFYLLRGKSQRHKAALGLLNAIENIGFLSGVIGYRKNHY